MKKPTLSIIALLTLSQLSFAGGDIIPVEKPIITAPVFVDYNDFYIGIGYSYISSNRTATHNIPGTPKHGEKARDVDSYAHSILLQTGYQFNPYFALEGRYTFSTSDLSLTDNLNNLNKGGNWDDDIDISNMALYLKPIYPIGNFLIYGLLGYGKVKRKDDDKPRGGTWDDSGFQWGAGLQYEVTNTFFIFADYTQWHDSKNKVHPRTPRLLDTDFSAMSIGLSYKF